MGKQNFIQLSKLLLAKDANPFHVKVDPGADCSAIPLSHFHTAFPKHFTKSGALKKSVVKPMYATLSAHDGECRNFLGYIVLNVQHTTTPKPYQSSFMFLKTLQIQPSYYLMQHHPD